MPELCAVYFEIRRRLELRCSLMLRLRSCCRRHCWRGLLLKPQRLSMYFATDAGVAVRCSPPVTLLDSGLAIAERRHVVLVG